MFIAFLLLAGVYLPRRLGFGFFDPHLTLMLASCGPFFQPNVVSASVFADPRTHFDAKLIASTLFGWFAGILFVTTGIIVVNVKVWHGSPVLPEIVVLIGCLLLGFCVSLFSASLYSLLALGQGNVEDAKKRNRFLMMATLVVLVLALQNGPTGWRDSISGRLNSEGMPAVVIIGCGSLLLVSSFLRRAAAHRHRLHE
jgi:hypothetical protein